MRISEIRIPKLTNRQAILKKTDAALKRLWQGAIKAFIFATAHRVRVQTGMARGTIVPLARVVRLGATVEGTIKADARSKELRKLRYNGPEGGYRSKTRGIQFGENAYHVSYSRESLEFEFEITVIQWRVNEQRWEALEEGRRAFEAYIDQHSNEYLLEIVRAVVEGI